MMCSFDMNSITSSKNKISKLYTLIVVCNEDKILLGFKKRGFGAGKWNGFGGKVEPGENIVNCAKRELLEECGLVAKSLEKIGVLWFEIGTENFMHEVHLFIASEYEGKEKESEEMIPKWFDYQDIPYDQMWPSNKYWLPKAISREHFDAFFVYENANQMVDMLINAR